MRSILEINKALPEDRKGGILVGKHDASVLYSDIIRGNNKKKSGKGQYQCFSYATTELYIAYL